MKKLRTKAFGRIASFLTKRGSVRIQITDVSVSGEDLATLKGRELPLEPFSRTGNQILAMAPLIPIQGTMTGVMYKTMLSMDTSDYSASTTGANS
jgi:hypothetical protein